MSTVVAILTRSFADPRIKARLAPAIPDEQSRRDLALAFLDDLLERCVGLAGVDVRVAVTPPIEGLRIARPTIRSDRIMAQRGATLGDRLKAVAEDLAAAGFARIVLLGADVPDLPVGHIQEAVAMLASEPAAVAIGSGGDGSYYLIGFNVRGGHAPDLFTSPRWKTPFLLEDTMAEAERMGLTVRDVGTWPDVDVAADLDELVSRLRYTPEAAPHTAAVLRRLGLFKTSAG